MKPVKFRSIKRKKQRFKGNRFTGSLTKSRQGTEDEEQSILENIGQGEEEETQDSGAEIARAFVVGQRRESQQEDVSSSNELTEDSFSSTISYSKLLGNEVSFDETKEDVSKPSGNRIIDLEILGTFITVVCCPECSQAKLALQGINKRGSATCFRIVCTCATCEWSYQFWSSAKGKFGGFDVNKRIVYSMRSCGQGYSGMERFLAFMNLPKPMAKSNYDNIVRTTKNAVKCIAEDTMKMAAQEIAEKGHKDDDGIVDAAISCDGSWQKRGFSSLNGLVACISMDTGRVVDVEPMSRYCKSCKQNEKLKTTDPARYKMLKESHTCGSNYSGSAPDMEATGAKRIFERSKQKNILRYSEFYGDGDSKSLPTIEYTYPEKRVLKRECIGHVQKRVGTRLRKLKKNIKGLGGKGKLTEALIDRLQNYYGIAIRSNIANLGRMKQSIHATLFHVASSDVNNWHQHCPEGKESWCSFKADRANGTKTYKAGKGLPLAVLQHVKPIFKDLSEDSLLERCLHGKTQNHNESFNGMVWNRIPKTTYVGFDQFQVGVYDATLVIMQSSRYMRNWG